MGERDGVQSTYIFALAQCGDLLGLLGSPRDTIHTRLSQDLDSLFMKNMHSHSKSKSIDEDRTNPISSLFFQSDLTSLKYEL